MKLKRLVSILQDVDVFKDPKVDLEQYPTTPQIAAEYLDRIETEYEGIEGKSVVDLGCGCGVLSIGAAVLGCANCLSIDIDEEALELCKENVDEMEIDNIDMLCMDVTSITKNPRLHNIADTVIMNPPFGTRNEGIDMKFVEAGLYMATESVYSLHKTSCRKGILKLAKRDWNINAEVIARVRFNIPKMYKHHTEKTKDIEVDCIRFSHESG